MRLPRSLQIFAGRYRGEYRYHARQEIEVRSATPAKLRFFPSCTQSYNSLLWSARSRSKPSISLEYSVMSGAVFFGQACVTHLSDLFNPMRYRVSKKICDRKG